MARWTFVTNHGAVLALIAHHGQVTARYIAAELGITERSVHRIIADLVAAGYIEKQKEGRANRYEVNHDLPLHRRDSREDAIGGLLRLLIPQNREEERLSAGDS